ncbi:hypothetical protein SOPP22_11130 [Shewanella sp. OPT22]|nr:hypothetical protein SOPP22_11130 [Shewanella sp. OPT22]
MDTVVETEIKEKEVEASEVKAPNKFQHDLDTAQNSVNIGTTLSKFSTFLHILGLVALLLVSMSIAKSGAGIYGALPFLVGAAVLLLSWAIIYALLSIVVTNGLTAKHSVYQSYKLERL